MNPPVPDLMGEKLTGRDIVIVSSIDWDWKWQGPQEMAVRFARNANRVLYIENPGVRAPRASDSKRLFKRLVNIIRSVRSSIREVETGVIVCTPVVLPPFGSRFRRMVNQRLSRSSVGRAIDRLGLDDPVVILCLPTDVAWQMTEAVATSRTTLIYYAISDLVVMTDHPTEMAKLEETVIRSADLVFTTYLPLVERYDVRDARVYLMPYGVDTSRFSVEGRSLRSDRDGVTLGYVGGISQHLDVELINGLAALRPDWNLVLVGPQQSGGEGIIERPNVQLLGHVRHAEIPEWIRGFDVCLIPYRRSDYTDTVYPVKLNEYLAVGKPVVSVDLPALVEFEEPGVLWLSEPDPQSFAEAIEEALVTSEDPSSVTVRRARAVAHDWEGRMRTISRLIREVERSDQRKLHD